jgi:hypothetical protein
MRELLVLALVACGSSQPTPAAHEQAAKQAEPAPAPVADTPCPATYAAATGTCTGTASCTYPEGTCACGPPSRCGGANIPLEGPSAWDCTPKPPEFRADGCPGVNPRGQPCTDAGKQCRYDECCMRLDTCQDGHWQETEKECPP